MISKENLRLICIGSQKSMVSIEPIEPTLTTPLAYLSWLAWKLVFSTRIVDPSHAINLTHVNRNRNTPMQLAVDHPSIPY